MKLKGGGKENLSKKMVTGQLLVGEKRMTNRPIYQ